MRTCDRCGKPAATTIRLSPIWYSKCFSQGEERDDPGAYVYDLCTDCNRSWNFRQRDFFEYKLAGTSESEWQAESEQLARQEAERREKIREGLNRLADPS